MVNKRVSFFDLKGKSVFITGGGSGIGAAITEAFISQGSNVSFVQRSDATTFCDKLEQKYKNRPHFLKCDISDTSALNKMIDAQFQDKMQLPLQKQPHYIHPPQNLLKMNSPYLTKFFA